MIGVPLDLGASRRGVDMGPSALRIAQLESKLEALGHEVEDIGNVARRPDGTFDVEIVLTPEERTELEHLEPPVTVELWHKTEGRTFTEDARLQQQQGYDVFRSFDEPGSYAGADLDVAATATVQYGHSLAEVVNSALGAGLKIQRLDEYLDADFDPRGDVMPREDDGRYRLRIDGELLPVLFALVAAKT